MAAQSLQDRRLDHIVVVTHGSRLAGPRLAPKSRSGGKGRTRRPDSRMHRTPHRCRSPRRKRSSAQASEHCQ